jgi:glycosyltransferase involved in cell wall biosynthesis
VRPALIASRRTLYQYETFLGHLLLGLADSSLPVALVCPPDFDAESLAARPVQIIRYPAIDLPLAGTFNRRMVVDQLGKFEPTVLHCLCEGRAAMTRRITRRLDLPYVLSVNSLHGRLAPLKISSSRCGRVLVSAKTVADNLARAQPRLAHRIERVNLGSFPASRCACFDDPSGLATIVTAHPLNRAGDFENLFTVLRHLKLEDYEFIAFVMGEGRAESHVRKMVAEFDLVETVTVVPPIRPWRRVLAAADIFVQPVVRRSFNPFLLEAMSVGMAVAACEGGVDDLVIEDQTAVVFDPKDELSLMRALQRLLGKRDFSRSLAEQAQEHIRRNHSVGGMISRIIESYQQAVDWYKP